MGRLPTYAFFFLFGYNKAKKKITSYNWFSFTIDVFSIIPFGMVESFLIGSRSGLKIQINYEMDFLMLYAHKLVKYYYVGSRSKETSRVLPFLFIQICGNVFRLMHSHRIYTLSEREERGCVIIDQDTSSMVVLLYPDISNFTF